MKFASGGGGVIRGVIIVCKKDMLWKGFMVPAVGNVGNSKVEELTSTNRLGMVLVVSKL